ncbi:RNase adapter RapZ [Peptostreptococcaceae bacterium AGR-M142]
MKFVIITGMSGAGKSEAMKALEDIGFYCVDNMPPSLLPKFGELCYVNKEKMGKIAISLDIRGRNFFDDIESNLEELSKIINDYEIVFFDTDIKILVQRYKMTRRNHPLSTNMNITEGIKKETQMLKPLKEKANTVINTTNMKPKDLHGEIKHMYLEEGRENNTIISLTSFGFKHGLPMDSDLVFDVRFLPNPYYDLSLRDKTGEDKEVRNYVMDSNRSVEFLDRLKDFITFLLPNYIEEGKNHIVISIGCTGGRHRSVTITNYLYDYLKEKDYRVIKKHRDFKLN